MVRLAICACYSSEPVPRAASSLPHLHSQHCHFQPKSAFSIPQFLAALAVGPSHLLHVHAQSRADVETVTNSCKQILFLLDRCHIKFAQHKMLTEHIKFVVMSIAVVRLLECCAPRVNLYFRFTCVRVNH